MTSASAGIRPPIDWILLPLITRYPSGWMVPVLGSSRRAARTTLIWSVAGGGVGNGVGCDNCCIGDHATLNTVANTASHTGMPEVESIRTLRSLIRCGIVSPDTAGLEGP